MCGDYRGQGIAIGWRFGQHLNRDQAVGAGFVVEQYRLAQHPCQRFANRPRHIVGKAARRIADQHADRFIWPGLLRP